MNSEERRLVSELFDRLATLEHNPRDADAERAIEQGLIRAPHAAYALVQTVLLQDEALKQANARLRELEGEPPEQERGFLDSMRDTLFGRGEEPRGSVPRTAGDTRPMGVPPGFRDNRPPMETQAGYPPQQQSSGGGGFLGTAAAAAAGVIGGGLLLGSIRNMLGSQQSGGPFQGAFDQIAGGSTNERSSWGGDAAGSDLSRDAGVGDIGRPRSEDVERASSFSGEPRDEMTGESGYEPEFEEDLDTADFDSGDLDFGGDSSET